MTSGALRTILIVGVAVAAVSVVACKKADWPDGSGVKPDKDDIAREGDSGLGLDSGTQI